MTPTSRMRRANRLRSSEGFSKAYATGVRARTPSVVAVGVRTEGHQAQVGVTCSRRVGGAVARNRAKRRLRAAIERYLPRLVPGSVVVLQATERTTVIDFQELVDEVGESLDRIGALAS